MYGRHWAPLSNVSMPLSCLFTWDLYLLLESTRQAPMLVGPLPVSVKKVISRPPASKNPLSPTLLHASLVVAQLPRPPVKQQTNWHDKLFFHLLKKLFLLQRNKNLVILVCVNFTLIENLVQHAFRAPWLPQWCLGTLYTVQYLAKRFLSTNPQTPVTFNH